MNLLWILCAFFAAAPSQAFGQANKPDAASVEKVLMQMEDDWTKAFTNKDVKTLERILADDWTGFTANGKAQTKAKYIESLKTGKVVVHSYQMGPMKVRFLGNVAVATGSQTEKATLDGKDNSGEYVWTDVFVNRNGRWQAIASHASKVEK